MAEQATPGGGAAQRYNREGLYQWARQRFDVKGHELLEEDFRTQPRSKLQAVLLDMSRRFYPEVDQAEIDKHLEETFHGTRLSEKGDAEEMAGWMRSRFHVEVDPAELTGVTYQQARTLLWNLFDAKYRPEMHRMERGILLNQLDSAWKKHLLTMDHLRSGIGLRGYAQEDPKVAYKREGMKEFEAMWDSVNDKVTDTVFRVEDLAGDEQFQQTLWEIQSASHAQAQSLSSMAAAAPEGTTNQASDKKLEPIRNTGDRVGRNDPCPCGSGKKYKNCHMRQATAK
jgi:preprotein translocase subunit SecA